MMTAAKQTTITSRYGGVVNGSMDDSGAISYVRGAIIVLLALVRETLYKLF